MSSAENDSVFELNPENIVPQRRSLIIWAVNYFDDWLQAKSRDEHSYLKDLKPRGWKKGIVDAFFVLKDSLYLKQKSSQVAGLGPQGKKIYLLMLCILPSDQVWNLWVFRK